MVATSVLSGYAGRLNQEIRIQRGLSYAAHSFATTYWVGFALMLAVFIPIAFLPRKRVTPPMTDVTEEEPAAAAPIIIH